MGKINPLYVIGDVQGCYDEFIQLLNNLPKNSDFILCGDLINRGNKSLEMIQWAVNENVKTVIGNHDIFLIAAICGIKKTKKTDTIEKIINHKDKKLFVDWLRFQPLLRLVEHADKKYAIVHAGLLYNWTFDFAINLAKEIEHELQGSNYKEFIELAFNLKQSGVNHKELKGKDYLAFGLSVFTRLRYCSLDGNPNFEFDDKPNRAPENLKPWFKIQNRKNMDRTIIAGHWSTLGLYQDLTDNVAMIDTEAVYGGVLTALSLDKPFNKSSLIQIPSKKYSDV